MSRGDQVTVDRQFLTAIKTYKCLACDARDIMEPNLVRHHQRKHSQIPIELNIFERIGRTLREKCNICQEGQLKAHKKRSHFERRRLVVLGHTADMPRCGKVPNRNTKSEVIQNTEAIATELHRCLKCRASVPKHQLQIHRKNHGKKVSKTENLFELIGVKDVIKCVACLTFVAPDQFVKHIRKHKTMTFVSADGEPFLPNPNSVNKRPEIKQNSFVERRHQKPQYLPKHRTIYKCRACEIIYGRERFIADSNGIEIQKHQRTHRKHSIQGNTFRSVSVQVKCNICDRYMEEKLIEKHMRIVHNWNYNLNFVQLYRCGCCDANGISKRNLAAHHSRMHNNFPIERNGFTICAVKQKVECDRCGKRYMEGRWEKHQLKTCVQRARTIRTVLNEQKFVLDAL